MGKKQDRAIELANLIRDTAVSIALMHWDRGEALEEILKRKLYQKSGFGSLAAFLEYVNLTRLEASQDIAFYNRYTEKEIIALAKKHSFLDMSLMLLEEKKGE